MPTYIPGNGNSNATLMFVGEAPSSSDEELGIPFTGASGELLWDICSEIGIDRNEIWATNVFKFRPPDNNIKRIHEVCNVDEQLDKLGKEIKVVNPNCILAIGGTAFQYLRGHGGIKAWRGSILTTIDGDRKLVGTIHTSNIVRTREYFGQKPWPYIWKTIIKLDIERALEESKFAGNTLPQRYVTVVRDSMQLRRIIDRNRARKRMSSDIESINCIPVCMGIAFDEYEAFVIPLFNSIGTVGIGGIPRSDQVFMWQQLDEILKEKDIVGQAYKYDQEKMEMLGFTYKRGRPIKSDTLLKCHTLWPELPSKKMEMQQSIWTKMPYHKDEGKGFNPKKDKIDKFFHYCGLDSLSTFATDEAQEKDLIELSDEVHVDMVKFFYEKRMPLHEIYLDMERVGFRLDMSAREVLRIKYLTQHEMIQQRFDDALPDYKTSKKAKKCHPDHRVNVASSPQIKNLIYGHLSIPQRTRGGKVKADEDTIVALLNNTVKDARKRAVLTDIIEDRRTRKTLGTYILSKPDADGRIRGTYRITGTETGRSSTAILKQPIRPSKSGHAFQTLTVHGTVGADIRTLYIADEGFVFVNLDLSQAEPRIVAVLSEDWELLNAFNSGKVDIHRRTAALVLDYTPDLDLSEIWNEKADTLDKEGGERFLGKKARNGGNYGMGAGELATNIATDAKRFNIEVTVSEWRAGKMIENFHKGSPKVRGVFHRDIEEAINYTRTLVNPYGFTRTFYERLEKKTYGEGYAHIPQSTVADHTKESMILIKAEMRNDFHQMLMGESHDALLFRFPVGEAVDRAKIAKRVMTRAISFRSCTLSRDVDLVIPVDCKIGKDNYKELEKLKI
jgi:uracil-DNA glycosylase family 4